MESPQESNRTPVRIDRWLWAIRAFRSRTLAARACTGGKVTINGASASPHKLVRVGDLVVLSTRDGKRQLRIVATAERRGPATVARGLYEDLTPVPPPLELPPTSRPQGGGRPTKRERRRTDKLRLR